MAQKGRPKTHPLEWLKTKIWFALCARGRTPYWFHINVDNYNYVQECQKKGDKVDRELIKGHKSKWEKYKNGKRTAPSNIVDIVAKMFPGSDDIFYSHIWTILKGQKVPTYDVIKEIENSSDATIKYILKDCYWDNTHSAVHSENVDNIIKRISELSNFEALRAIILCLSWANEIENHIFWNELCNLYHRLLPRIILDYSIPHRFELLVALDDFALFRQFSSDTSRNDIKRSWHDQLAASKNYLIDHYSNALSLHDSFFGWPKLLFNQEYRQKLAEQMVDIVWENKSHRFQSLDYWGHLGELYAEIIKNGLENDALWKNNRDEIAMKILDDWHKEKKKEEKEFTSNYFVEPQNNFIRRLPINQNNFVGKIKLNNLIDSK